jgi:hypothetical protein
MAGGQPPPAGPVVVDKRLRHSTRLVTSLQEYTEVFGYLAKTAPEAIKIVNVVTAGAGEEGIVEVKVIIELEAALLYYYRDRGKVTVREKKMPLRACVPLIVLIAFIEVKELEELRQAFKDWGPDATNMALEDLEGDSKAKLVEQYKKLMAAIGQPVNEDEERSIGRDYQKVEHAV